MIQSAPNQMAAQSLRGQLMAAYNYLIERHDQENSEKVRQLAGKLRDGEFAIAFCGHFSAGKSTMINRLIGEKLLPSSPIPTSANLVKVKAGEEYAKVFFKTGKPRIYLAPYDYTMVKNYCKDGDAIESIEISHAGSKLPPHTVIMDTPGIDSADDAHRIATESAIHLADLILYVMDYNHVQSELNFMFTKELTEAGKEVYLVINQVDKHNEAELSFDDFKSGAAAAFAAWGVKPADMFFTSLRYDDHAHNEFSRLQDFLAQRLQQKDQLLRQSIAYSLQKILNDHLTTTGNAAEQKLQPDKAILAELSPERMEVLEETYAAMLAESQLLAEGSESAEQSFDREINKIMTNAYLMPFEIRALAESYLEACQPKFKVGWLASKKKTAAEKEARKEAFYAGIQEKTKAQLDWHLRAFLLDFAQSRHVDDNALYAKIQNFSIQVPTDLPDAAVKEGAQMSGEYVLNYTDSVANEIKRLTKSALFGLKEELLDALKTRNDAMQEKLNKKAAGLEKYINALKRIRQHEQAQRNARSALEQLLDESGSDAEDTFQLFDAVPDDAEIIQGTATAVPVPESIASEPLPQPNLSEPTTAAAPVKLKHTADRLLQAATLVKDLPGFAKLSHELAEKSARLAHKGFTVALFGAFSAGKSSFANALLGESILPVSPNPMTAAINKIKPIDEANRHGTVRVKLKEESALLTDINHALHIFDLQAANLDDVPDKIESLRHREQDALGAAKTHYAFLQAFSRGYAAFRGQLGTTRTATINDFGDYVAQEEKSCFVEWIDLYYDCPLTRKGITLVDTPGADSINARHTGVAFEFIKNSDAILFVTYYNHAFSKADREFLIQLGRVKDAFQLDKMFFIINAIDLAEDEEEKDLVSAYVKEQLVKYWVRNPHLYPLSSLTALREKQEHSTIETSGMPLFETQFYKFIMHDLANLATQASELELKRVYRLVEKLIGNAQEDAAAKQRRRSHIETEKNAVLSLLGRQTATAAQERLCQETEELVFYIRQRVFLRFNEFFRESFNPNVLRDDGRDLKKVLRNALEELIGEIGFVFAEEMRATTVRLDRFAEKLTSQMQSQLGLAMEEINSDLTFSSYENNEKVQISFAPAFEEIQLEIFHKALSIFKNTKSFFEKNESKHMSEEIQRILSCEAEKYLSAERQRLQECYGCNIEAAFAEMTDQMRLQADDFYLSLLSALDGGVPIEELLRIRDNLNKLA